MLGSSLSITEALLVTCDLNECGIANALIEPLEFWTSELACLHQFRTGARIGDEKPTYRYRLAACRKDPAEVIVRRLSCHAAPSDTAVFYKELRVTLATARTLRSSQKTLKRLFEPQHGGRQLGRRQRVKIFEDGRRDIRARPVNRSRLHSCIEDA